VYAAIGKGRGGYLKKSCRALPIASPRHHAIVAIVRPRIKDTIRQHCALGEKGGVHTKITHHETGIRRDEMRDEGGFDHTYEWALGSV